MEQHPILAAVYYNDDSGKRDIIHFDGYDTPEQHAADALLYGKQQGYKNVEVSSPFIASQGGAYWRLNGDVVETGVSHEWDHKNISDEKIAALYAEGLASGKTADKPVDIEACVNKPRHSSRLQPYEMYTKDMSQRDFNLLEFNVTPQKVDALIQAGKMSSDMQAVWERSGLNRQSTITGQHVFTSEMLHLLPERYQPVGVKTSHQGLNFTAEAEIDGKLMSRTWAYDGKGVYEYGAPSKAELAGHLLDDYMLDNIEREYDIMQKGFVVEQRRGKDYAIGDWNNQRVAFATSYGPHSFTDDEVKDLFAGNTITVGLRSGDARVALGDCSYNGHDYIGVKRVDMPQKKRDGLDISNIAPSQPEKSGLEAE